MEASISVVSWSSGFFCDGFNELHLLSDCQSWCRYTPYSIILRLLGFGFGLWRHLDLPATETAVNKAYQYSSITSVTILDCWTIAWVIILTWIFLGTRYTPWQFFGAAICVSGLVVVLLSDSGVGDGGGSRPILGDVLVIAGTVFFALSNVGEEFCVKKKDRVEVVSMLSLFAMLVSIGQIAIVERKSLESVKWSSEIILAFFGYAAASFTFYSVVPFVMKMSGATLFNLSILTSDMWAVVIRIFFYKQHVDWLYYLAFALVVVGLIIYSKSEKNPTAAIEDEDPSSQDRLLDEETSDFRNQAAPM